MTFPGITLEDEFRRRNNSINAVAAYCNFEEGGTPRNRAQLYDEPSPTKQADTSLMATNTEKEALSAAVWAVLKEGRPTICFLCLGKRGLSLDKRVYSFVRHGDLSKHFKRKHLSKCGEKQQINCKVCRVTLENKVHCKITHLRYMVPFHKNLSYKEK